MKENPQTFNEFQTYFTPRIVMVTSVPLTFEMSYPNFSPIRVQFLFRNPQTFAPPVHFTCSQIHPFTPFPFYRRIDFSVGRNGLGHTWIRENGIHLSCWGNGCYPIIRGLQVDFYSSQSLYSAQIPMCDCPKKMGPIHVESVGQQTHMLNPKFKRYVDQVFVRLIFSQI